MPPGVDKIRRADRDTRLRREAEQAADTAHGNVRELASILRMWMDHGSPPTGPAHAEARAALKALEDRL